MKHISNTIKLVLSAVLLCSFAYGQGSEMSKAIIAKLGAFSAGHTAEKAYLQFDKPYYAAGDTIYFKAYVTNGEHKLSGLSGVLHVDLVNTNNKIDQTIKLKLDSGVAWGDFALPDTLPGGNYRVRAYTQWMRNEGTTGFFDKVIPVGSLKGPRIPESLLKQSAQLLNLKPDVQFFPEGGSLIAGIRSKIAFKAVGKNGVGIDIKGTVVDDANKQVVLFASSHLGMGYFYLSPEEGKTYKASITYPNGSQDAITLPKPEANGVVLSVNNDSLPKASVRIEANPACYNENKNKGYTLAIYSGGVLTTVNCKLDDPVINLDILKRKLHTGVATVTLFSPQNEPLTERLLFVQNYDQLNLNVSSDKSSYAKREKVNIKLNAINRKGEASEGNFSVSVIDESKVPGSENNSDNILTGLLLTSDLKGYIEQPGYYFSDTSAAARHDLDVLMLTQGYRRFSWKQVMSDDNQALAYQPEKGIEIAGAVKSFSNKPIKNGTVMLISEYKGPVLTSVTDDKGMFRFQNLIFNDTARFVLSAVNASGKNSTKITYINDKDSAPAPAANPQQVVQAVTDTAIAPLLNNDKLQQEELVKFGHAKGIMLKEVKIHEKKLDDQYRTQSLAGAGHADQVLHSEDIKYGATLSAALNGRLHGVIFNGGYPILQGIGLMSVYVDGARLPLDTRAMNLGIDILNPNDIETIEVLKYANAAIYGVDGGHGVLVITTKQGGGLSTKDIVAVGVLPVSPMGFYKAKEFYSPKYDHVDMAGKQRDLRSTIYWNPEVKTDKDGNAGFEYFNADGAGRYKIVLEGIDSNGNIGRQVYSYKVE